MKEDCVLCKNSKSHGGPCIFSARNCINFVEDTRGRRITKSALIQFNPFTHVSVIEVGKEIEVVTSKGKVVLVEIIRIQKVDFINNEIDVILECYEHDFPLQKSDFHVIDGGLNRNEREGDKNEVYTKISWCKT